MMWRCTDCDWIGEEQDLLRAPHPFQSDDEAIGCPQCRDLGPFRLVCDEPGCLRDATCGTPTRDGYRNICGDHYSRLRAALDGSHE